MAAYYFLLFSFLIYPSAEVCKLTCRHLLERKLSDFTKGQFHPNAHHICREAYFKCIENEVRKYKNLQGIDLQIPLSSCLAAIEAFNDRHFTRNNPSLLHYFPPLVKKDK